MSFIGAVEKGKIYAPGYFLAHEDCTRVTVPIYQQIAKTAADGSKYVPMGTVYPTNDNKAIGIVYEDVDVTTGDMPGSVVAADAVVYEDRLPVEMSETAKTALEAKGFVFAESPAAIRPDWTNN